MESGLWEVVTNPYLLGICTILGIPIGLLGIHFFSGNQPQRTNTVERVVEREVIHESNEKNVVQKKREPVETLTKAAMVAPVAYKAADVAGDALKRKIAMAMADSTANAEAVKFAGNFSAEALESASEATSTGAEAILEHIEKVSI